MAGRRRGSKRFTPLVLASAGVAVSTALGLAANIASGAQKWPGPLQVLHTHSWIAVAALTMAAGVLAAAAAYQGPESSADPDVPSALRLPDWTVPRGEAHDVIAAVCSPMDSGVTVGITTGVFGAGGFGKTTVALMAAADQRVRRRFRGRVYVVTVGRDIRSPAQIAALVAEQTHFITGDEAAFGDPAQAGEHLGRLLSARRRTLLVIDDVWEPEQLAPFLLGAPNCVRLVTTRVPKALPDYAVTIRVDRMSIDQARQVLTWELPALPEAAEADLLKITGSWALLVRLANRAIVEAVSTGVEPAVAAEKLVSRLRSAGPTVVDDPAAVPNLNDPARRNTMVRASVRASVEWLPSGFEVRFAELGIFAEDEAIPVTVVAALWAATAGFEEDQTRQLCRRLANLSLISLDPAGGGRIGLHDVIRDYLRAELGPEGIAEATRRLLEAVGGELPEPPPLADSTPTRAWWHCDGYLLDHLIEHFIDAGWLVQAEVLVRDLRWIQARLEGRGPAAPAADLSRIAGPEAAELARDMARAAHLLTPTEPAHALASILRSRLQSIPVWSAQVAELDTVPTPLPRLSNAWLPPDPPDPALLRTLTGHSGPVRSVAFSSHGSLIAGGDSNGLIHVWEVATGRRIRILTGLDAPVLSVMFNSSDTRIGGTIAYGTLRIWDATTGQPVKPVIRNAGPTSSMGFSADESRLATAGEGAARLWDTATGELLRAEHARYSKEGIVVAVEPRSDFRPRQEQIVLKMHAARIVPDSRMTTSHGAVVATVGDDGAIRLWDSQLKAPDDAEALAARVESLAFAPDASLIATSGGNGTVRLWNAESGELLHTMERDAGRVGAVAISRDGTLLATGSSRGAIRIWHLPTRRLVNSIASHAASADAVAFSPNGDRLATGGEDSTVRLVAIAGRAGANELPVLCRHDGHVTALAVSPDGTWLLTGSTDRTARIWEVATGRAVRVFSGHTDRINAVAISPRGGWLATGSSDQTVRLWDVTTGRLLRTLSGHSDRVNAVAINPSGSYIAVGTSDGTVRVWAPAMEKPVAMMRVDGTVTCCAWAPEGLMLAVGGSRGLYGFRFHLGEHG